MRSVHSKHTLLERVLDAYRNGDLEECIRRVRTLVEAAPMATAPRQLLASVYAQAGNQRLALAHYRKLLPAAISRGEVFVALAIQKQIDSLEPPESLPEPPLDSPPAKRPGIGFPSISMT